MMHKEKHYSLKDKNELMKPFTWISLIDNDNDNVTNPIQIF